jgi:hypothetical protein
LQSTTWVHSSALESVLSRRSLPLACAWHHAHHSAVRLMRTARRRGTERCCQTLFVARSAYDSQR